MSKWTEDLSKALDSVQELAFKAVPTDGVNVSHSPGQGDGMRVTVNHGAGAQARSDAIDKAHAVAKEHGYDPAQARIGSTYGSGDSHSTSVSYGRQNGMQNSGMY